MQIANEKSLNGQIAPDSNRYATIRQASPKFREQFLNLIRESYPGIRQLRFKKKRRYYVVRAQFGPRELCSRARTPESAASRFFNEVSRKVISESLILDRHYASLDIQ